jgi:hypothetical protein
MSAATRAVGLGAENLHHNNYHYGTSESAAGDAPPVRSSQSSTVLTRTLYVNVTGSLANLAMQGPSAGTWKLVDGKGVGVFGMGSEVDSQVPAR